MSESERYAATNASLIHESIDHKLGQGFIERRIFCPTEPDNNRRNPSRNMASGTSLLLRQ